MVDDVKIQSRKARRKQERSNKKLKRKRQRSGRNAENSDPHPHDNDGPDPPKEKYSTGKKPVQNKRKKISSSSSKRDDDPYYYSHLDAATAAAMRRDDEEIAALNAKLGLSDPKGKKRLNREYAKLEGYGDDFGTFLEDLDGMVQRVTRGSAHENDDDSQSDDEGEPRNNEPHNNRETLKSKRGSYDHMEEGTAAALRRDDEEIAALEAKLGLTDKKEKSRLHKEYITQECYGEDFGEFLNDLDGMVKRVVNGDGDDDDGDLSPEERSDTDEDEEIIPMKEPAFDDLDEDDSVMAEIEAGENAGMEKLRNTRTELSSGSELDEDSDEEDEPDHDTSLTYTPTEGEDIYGNTLESSGNGSKPQKYVPPHLRKKKDVHEEDLENKSRQGSLRQIQRSVNSPLNRLSEGTLVSVAQSIAKVYPLFPTSDVNEYIWKIAKNACIARSHSMAGLIPLYIAALCGVHVIKGDSAQLGEYLMEKIVLNLWDEVDSARMKAAEQADFQSDDELVAKEASNLMLCLCYLYNFGVVHCSLIYDVVRDFIKHFHSVDVELLLLILSHCGRTLRSDDPSALKDIVLLVQKRALETKDDAANASHVDFMISAIMDLKNNKRRGQSNAYIEKTTRLRKALGQIKSSVANKNGGFRSESSQRISLSDLLNADVKGRYWKVGASWIGNQPINGADDNTTRVDRKDMPSNENRSGTVAGDSKLLKLATKYRMNTDVRRAIFFIIMGSSDCDDAFEKLVRAEMLKNRAERDTVRVLMECCGNEKSYNKYYSHLAARICEFQPQAKFSFQLAFWDAFKTFDTMKARKAANLAKLLFYLVAVHFSLKLSVLKAIDMSSPEELSETSVIFVTIFLSSLLEHFDEPSGLVRLIDTGIGRKKVSHLPDNGESELERMDDGDALRANLTVFLVQVLKASPKYKKGSKFRANLKAAVKVCDMDNF